MRVEHPENKPKLGFIRINGDGALYAETDNRMMLRTSFWGNNYGSHS